MKTNKKIDSTLGKLFKEQRIKSGLSQQRVCKLLGYSTSQFLSNFERGLCNMPLPKLKEMIELYSMDSEQVVSLIMDLQDKFLREELVSKKAK